MAESVSLRIILWTRLIFPRVNPGLIRFGETNVTTNQRPGVGWRTNQRPAEVSSHPSPRVQISARVAELNGFTPDRIQ